MYRSTPTQSIETLGTRAKNALCDAGLLTLGAVIDQSDRALSALPEFGGLSLKEIRRLRQSLAAENGKRTERTMTIDEELVFDLLVEAWNVFVTLPVEHADDNDEFRHGIHILQRQIMARPVRRLLNAKA